MAVIPRWRDRATGWLLAVGILSLCVGIGIYLVTGFFDRSVAILLALGVALVGWYVVEDYQTVLAALRGRRARYGGNTAAMVLIFIAILGVLNFLSVRHSLRWDLTAERDFSLSTQTLKILESLKEPVKIKGFFREGDYGRTQAQDLLKEYQRHNDKIQFEFIDWEIRPGDALAYKLQSFPVIVMESGSRRQDVTGFTEQDLTSGIFKVSTGEAKRVLFTAGHGEADISATNEGGLAAAKQALESSNYRVEALNLASTPSIGDDVGGIVLANPKTALLDPEKKALKDYVERGGKVMVLVSPRQTTDLSDLLGPLGLQISDGYAIDAQALVNQPYVPVITSYPQFSPITRDIQGSNQAVLLPMAAQIAVSPQLPEGEDVVQLLATSARSWIAKNEKDITYRDGDTKGPLTLAVAVTVPAMAAPSGTAGPDQPAKNARVVVFGSSDFATNLALGAMANQQLFVNAVNWLTEDENLISIRPQEPVDRSLQLTGTQANLLLYSSVIFLPLLVAAGGGYVWWRRR